MKLNHRFSATVAALAVVFVNFFASSAIAAELTPRYYVQDSLLMMLDAEYNSTNEFGEIIHDSSATRWIDLSGNGYDFTKNSGGSWADKHFNFNGRAATGVKKLPWYFTQEVVCSVSSGRYVFLGFVYKGQAVQMVVTAYGTTNRFQTSFLTARGPTKWIDASAAEKAPFTLTSLYSESIDSGQKSSYVSGVGPDTSYTGDNSWGVDTSPLIGNVKPSGSYPGTGKLYSIRLYTRELTPDEIVRNSEIDDIRFRGKAPPVPLEPAVSGLQVAGGPSGTALVTMSTSSYGYLATRIDSAYLEYSADGTFEDIVSVPFGMESGGCVQCTVTGLNPGATYQARIVATNDYGAGAVSPVFSVTASSSADQPSIEIVSLKPGDYYVDVTAVLRAATAAEVAFSAYLGDNMSELAGSASTNAVPGAEFTIRVNALSPEKEYVIIPSVTGTGAATGSIPFWTLSNKDEIRRGRAIEIVRDSSDETKLIATFDAPGKATALYLLADEIDRGTGEWAYTSKVCDVSADTTEATVVLPEGWGTKFYALRCFLGDEGDAFLPASQRYKTDDGINMFAQWDAIDNTDVDVYSPAPSQWNDLVRGMPMLNAASYAASANVTNVCSPKSSYLSVSWGLPRIFIEHGRFTVEGYLMPTQNTDEGGIISFGAGNGARLLTMDLRGSSGSSLRFAIQYRRNKWPTDHSPQSVANAATKDTYQHYAMVCDGDTVRTYVDGVLIHTGVSGGKEGTDDIMFGRYINTSVINRYCAIRFYDGPLSLDTLAANRAIDRGRFTRELEIAPSAIAMSATAYHYVSSSAPSLNEPIVSGLETGDTVELSGTFSGKAETISVLWWTEGAVSTQTVDAVINGSVWTADLCPCAPGVENFYKVMATAGALYDIREGVFTPLSKVTASVEGPTLQSATVSYTVRVTEQGAGDTYVWVRRGLTQDTLEDLGQIVKINAGDMAAKTVSAYSPVFGQAYYYSLVVSNSCSNAENGSWSENCGISRKTVVDQATYTVKAAGAWSDPSTWAMSGTGQGYPNGSSSVDGGSPLRTVSVDGSYTVASLSALRSISLTGSVENASVTCDIKGTGNGLSGVSLTFVDVAITEANGVSMYGGTSSGNNSVTLKGNARYTTGGGFTMASSSASRPVTITVSDSSIFNASGFINISGAGVFNVNLVGAAPKLWVGKIGEQDSSSVLKGSLNFKYVIPSEIAAVGYADTPLRITSASASAGLGYFSNAEEHGTVTIGIDPSSGVFSNIHPCVDFTLAEARAGIVTNNITLAERVGNVVFDWEWRYGWNAEENKSLQLDVPEAEGELPTALSLRFYRPGTILMVR